MLSARPLALGLSQKQKSHGIKSPMAFHLPFQKIKGAQDLGKKFDNGFHIVSRQTPTAPSLSSQETIKYLSNLSQSL